MSTVTHPLVDPDVATLTTDFLNSAAALETRLRDTELRLQTVKRELRRMEHRQERAHQWIVALRRSHRRDSHATTAKVFKRALTELATLDLKTVTMPATLLDCGLTR